MESGGGDRPTPKSSLYEAVQLLPHGLPHMPHAADKLYRALHAMAALCSLTFDAVPGFRRDVHDMLRELADALAAATPHEEHTPARWVG